jgi:hypothetical protein
MENRAKLTHEFLDKTSLTTLQSSALEPIDSPPRPMTGFFAALSPEQQEAALRYCGPEDLGEPNTPVMTFK